MCVLTLYVDTPTESTHTMSKHTECVSTNCAWNVCVEILLEMFVFKLYVEFVCWSCAWNFERSLKQTYEMRACMDTKIVKNHHLCRHSQLFKFYTKHIIYKKSQTNHLTHKHTQVLCHDLNERTPTRFIPLYGAQESNPELPFFLNRFVLLCEYGDVAHHCDGRHHHRNC